MTAPFTRDQNDFLRYYLPYHFQKLPHERLKHVYLPLNRAYLPLGFMGGRVNLREHMSECVVFDSDPHYFADVWFDPVGLFLYGDGPESKRGYSDRLGRLLSRRIRTLSGIR